MNIYQSVDDVLIDYLSCSSNNNCLTSRIDNQNYFFPAIVAKMTLGLTHGS